MDQVSLIETEGRWQLRLTGPLEPSIAESAYAAALQAAASDGDVGLDWSQAEYLSAPVLQILLALGDGLRRRERRLVVSAGNGAIQQYLELAGVADSFPPIGEAR